MRVNERMKKLLSIVLTLCMVLSYIPAPAYAVATDFAVTIAEATNGKVEADKTTATEGDTITLTVTADEGYELDTLTVMNGETAVEVNDNSFIMPAGNVTVSATFKEVASGIQAGYYLVGTLNGENKLSVDQESSDRLLKEDTNVEGQYCLEYTFAAGDELKIAYFDGQEITKWYKDDDFYPISEAKAGKCILLFRPEGNEIWSSTYFTVTPAYSVTVNTVENGAVTADKAVATADETVTLKVTPAEGYEIDTVSYNDGADHTIAPVEGVYSFTMPAGDVTVTATFKIPTCTCTVKCGETVDTTCTVCSADPTACEVEEPPVAATDNIDAAAMTAEELKAAVDAALAAGYTAITVNLAEDADAAMFSAITAALATTVDPSLDHYELVMNYSGTIDLTISGAKTVPECTFYVDEYVNENWRAGAALRSVTLTDATTIGESAFFSCAMTSFSAPNVIEIEGFALEGCMKLTDVYLPSVQTLGDAVFSDCYALTTISLPECIDLGNGVFNSCEALETVYAPKATNLGAIEFMMCTSLMKVTLGSVVSVNQLYESIDNGLFCLANDTKNIELILDCNQKALSFDSGTKYWTATEEAFAGDNQFIGYTFKSITTVHIPAADDGDCTTAVKCTTCGETVVEAKESHTGGTATCTTQAVCDLCGTSYGELAEHSVDSATGKCRVCQTQFAVRVDTWTVMPDSTGLYLRVDITKYYTTLADAAADAYIESGSTLTVLTDASVPAEATYVFSDMTVAVNPGATLTVDGRLTLTGSSTLTNHGDWAGEGFVTVGEQEYKVFDKTLYYYGGEISVLDESQPPYVDCTDVPGITYWKADEGYLIFTPASAESVAVLELHNAVFTVTMGSVEVGAISHNHSMEIHFYGENTLTVADSDNYGAVLEVSGTATMIAMEENATLNISTCGRYGIDVDALEVESGTVSIRSGNNSENCAVRGAEKITVSSGAVLNLAFGEADEYGAAYGAGAREIIVEEGGTLNGLTVEPSLSNTTFGYLVHGNTVLDCNLDLTFFAALTDGDGSFTVPTGTSLTVAQGKTLDLSAMKLESIDFSGKIINYGTIKLPEGFSMDNAPKGGTVTVGDKSYTWDGDNGKWICGENSHIGGEATCTAQAVCTICGNGYGELDKENHASTEFTYTDNGNGTHSFTCAKCDAVVDSEPHTIENHACTDCGAMEIVVSFNAGDYEWKTGDTLYFCRVSGDNEWEEYAFTATVAGDGTVTWTPDRTLYWDGTGEHKLVVIYPNTGYVWDTWYIDEDQSTLENLRKNDHLNSIWSGNPTTDTITFNLKHRMAKVTVNYEAAEGVTVSKAEVYTLTQYVFFDVDTLERRNIAWEEGDDLWIHSYLNDGQFTAFVSPDAYAADGNFIKITLSDGSVREVKMSKAVTFEEGAEYTYTVVITADGAYLTCADECTFEYTDNGDGTHTATCSKCGYAVTEEHTLLTCSASGNVITGSCSKCPAVDTATITAENTTYNGTAQETATVAYSAGWKGGELTVSYANNTNAGTATASITIGEATASVEFTIAKAEIDGETLINPEFAEGLIYNGTAQALVTKTGSVDGGYIVYSLSIDGEYTTTIPVATEAGTYRVYWTIECDENHYVDGTPGSSRVTIAKANPEYTVPTGLTATYGDTLAKVELPTGWAWNDAESTSVGNAGTRTFKALYNPDSNNYNTVEADVTVEVAKADPEYTVPAGLTATYGNTLADVELPAGWTWKDAETTSVGNVGKRTFKVLYNPDSNNYNTVEADVTIEVAKALIDIYTDNLINPEFAEGLIYNGTAQALVTNSGSIDGGYIVFSLNPDGEYTTEIPVATEAGEYVVYYRIEGDENHYWEGSSAFEAVTIAKANPEYTVPTGLTATYGDTLAKVELPTGWAWKDAETTSVGNTGTRTFKALYNPDSNNYNTVEADVTVEVAKADPEYTVPTGLTATYSDTLADVELPAGWTWKDAETTSVGNAGTRTFKAVFTPADTVNYNTVEADVTIEVAKAEIDGETLINPEFAEGLIYNGTAQALVTKTGSVDGGYIVYSLSIDGEYTTTIPVATEAGTYRVYWTIECDENHYVDGTPGSSRVTIAAKAITVTADAVSKTYGDTDPTLTYKVEGLVNGDELTGELKRVAGENVGSYAIEQNTLTAGSNYSITYTGAKLTINAKAITEADVELNGSLTYTGKEQTQPITVTAGITYEVTGNKATNVGTYELTVKGIGNYTGEVKLNWSIKEAAAVVGKAPTAKELTYTGTAQALVNAGTTADGKLVYSLSENGEFTDSIPTGTNAGEYTVWYYVQGDDNHSDTAKASVKVTIAKADPVIGTVGCEMDLYDSTAISNVELTRTDMSVDGILVLTDSELTAGEGTYNWKFTPKDTDNYNTITGTVVLNVTADVLEKIEASGNLEKDSYSYGDTFSIDGLTVTATYTTGATKDVTELVNFDSNLAVGQTSVELTYQGKTCTVTGFTVAKKQLVIDRMAWDIPENAVYNGTEYTATLNGTLPTGVVVTLSGDKATNAGNYTAKAVFSLAEGYSADNYEIVNGADLTADWTIAKKNIAGAQITLGTALTYNGKQQTQTVTKVEIDGLTVTYTVSGNTGTDAKGYTLTITGSGNFEGTETKEWSIAKKNISGATITLGDSLTYNGTERTQEVTDVKIGDLTVTYDVTANKQTNAGNYTLTVTGNGNFEGSVTADWSIAKAKLTITANNNSITYGDVPAASGVTGTGFVSSESIEDLSGELTYSYNYEQFGNVGTYKITPSGVTSNNYEITFADGTLTVDAKPITVTADAVSKTYGEADPALTYKVEGLVNGDELTGELKRAAGENVGSYAIEQNTLTAGSNYSITYTGAKLTINAKAITEADVELNGSLTYTGKEQTQPITVTAGITYEVTGNKATNVGTYELTVQGTGNYTGSVTLDWTIAKAKLTITADSKVIYIGEKVPTLTYTASGLVGGDKLTKEPVLTTNADADQAGSYTITAANADAGDNYTITYVSGSLTIMDKETEVETKIEQTELTEVPEGLKDTQFDTVEEIKEELISKILATSTGYSAESMVHYDVALHFSLDGGDSWILATEENFPTEGITVILPYPEGTNARDYEFVVSHMFTVTSQRLGTVAGEVEMPKVEETANGIRVTLNGLSPVTVAARYHDHTGGIATCTDKAICSICGTAYGELDATNHAGGTEVKNAKEATCGAEGYTGDTYCKGCNEVVEKGTTIKATGEHTYGDWKVVKEPTKTTKGEKQRICSVCGHVDSKEIPVLSDTPATGDNSNIMLYSSMFTVSLAGLVVLLLAAKKRKQETA